VDAVSKLLSTNSIEADILHYQMLFQVNKKDSSSGGNPLLPRTIILTPSVLLLCDEDLCNEEVSVKIIDRVEVKNIWRMRQVRLLTLTHSLLLTLTHSYSLLLTHSYSLTLTHSLLTHSLTQSVRIILTKIRCTSQSPSNPLLYLQKVRNGR
jgi:hypothetical protein